MQGLLYANSGAHPLDVDKRPGFVVDELASKLGSLIRVEAGDVLQERSVVGGVVNPLGVDDDLGELASLSEAGAADPERSALGAGRETSGTTYTTLLGTLARK